MCFIYVAARVWRVKLGADVGRVRPAQVTPAAAEEIKWVYVFPAGLEIYLSAYGSDFTAPSAGLLWIPSPFSLTSLSGQPLSLCTFWLR